MPEYLDFNGLTRYNNKIKAINATLANNGVKNLLNFNAWKDVEMYHGIKEIDNNVITITATGTDCYTRYSITPENLFPETARITVTEGHTYVFTWNYVALNDQTNDKVYVFKNGISEGNFQTSSTTQKLSCPIPTGVTFITFRLGVYTQGNSATYSNLMIRDATILDSTYQPYAQTNVQLTEFVQNPLTTTEIDTLWNN